MSGINGERTSENTRTPTTWRTTSSNHQHSDETSSSQQKQQRRASRYLMLVGILVLFTVLLLFAVLFYDGVFSLVSPFQSRRSKKESSTCIPQPNQPLVNKHFEITHNKPQNSTGINFVICSYNDTTSYMHLPHVMQQLYRCYSLWRDYPKAKAFFLAPNYETLAQIYRNPFVVGLMSTFHGQMELSNILESDLPPGGMDEYKRSEVTIVESFTEGYYSLRHTEFLHRIVEKELELQDDTLTVCQNSKPRIGILNRQEPYHRSILNAEEIADSIQNFSRDGSVQVKYFEQSDFRDQVEFFRSVDILVSPHGAQLTGVAFMNAPCAHVLELFPKRYHIPKYFGSLVSESNKEYSYLYLSANASKSERARTYNERNKARVANLCPSTALMTETIRTLADQWRQCCAQRL